MRKTIFALSGMLLLILASTEVRATNLCSSFGRSPLFYYPLPKDIWAGNDAAEVPNIRAWDSAGVEVWTAAFGCVKAGQVRDAFQAAANHTVEDVTVVSDYNTKRKIRVVVASSAVDGYVKVYSLNLGLWSLRQEYQLKDYEFQKGADTLSAAIAQFCP